MRWAAIRESVLYATVQASGYCLITINFRAVASGRLTLALLTDGINATMGFFIFRRFIHMKDEDSMPVFVGYLLGSLAGTALGMYIDAR